MASNRESQRNILYNTEQHRAKNDYVKDVIDRQKSIVNGEEYNVEISNDFSIPVVSDNLVEQHKDITGYTAGLITRDLVSMGEQIMMKKDKTNNRK